MISLRSTYNQMRISIASSLCPAGATDIGMGSQVQHETPEEGRRTYWPKHCECNNEDENSDPNTLSNTDTFVVIVVLVYIYIYIYIYIHQPFHTGKK